MIKFQGNPVNLEGTEVKLGETFRDFILSKNDLSSLTLENTKGVRVFLTVPSLDTPVCDMEIRNFNEKISDFKDVTCYTVSMDLPFAQSRWCGSAGIKNVITVSDYKDRSFGKSTGTYIKELGLLTRAAFVVDSNNKVVYVEYVEEITNEPNYEKILDAVSNIK